MTRKTAFLLSGIILGLIALPFRFHPRCILPNNYEWSGDFTTSEWALRVTAFADVMNIVLAAATLLIILSFTRLTDK